MVHETVNFVIRQDKNSTIDSEWNSAVVLSYNTTKKCGN